MAALSSRPKPPPSAPTTTTTTTAANAAATAADANDGLSNPKDDICPVCKSSRYFNPTMKLLVSPECWHRMCESCVARIFGHGPAQCPIAGCKRTLRRHRFRAQTFEDIRVEREVDARREVADVLAARESDFDSLRAYNDFLEQVESLTFNLVHGVDVAATRATLDAVRAQHAAALHTNAARDADEQAATTARAAAEREASAQRRSAAVREAASDRAERANANHAVIASLAAGGDGDAAAIAAAGQRSLDARLSARHAQYDNEQLEEQLHGGDKADTQSKAGVLTAGPVAGLKQRVRPTPQAPYSPFGGVRYTPRWGGEPGAGAWRIGWLDGVRADARVVAGGYDVGAYTARAMTDAFAGLGVFVGEGDGTVDGGDDVF